MKKSSGRLIHNMIISFMLTGAITCASIASYEAVACIDELRILNNLNSETRQILTSYAQTDEFKEIKSLTLEDLEYQRSNELIYPAEYEDFHAFLNSLDFVSYTASKRAAEISLKLADNESKIQTSKSKAVSSATTAVSGIAATACIGMFVKDILTRENRKQHSL